MGMDKAAIEYVNSLVKPEVVSIGGNPFSDRLLKPVMEPSVDCIAVNTLSGLVDFVNVDPLPAGPLLIHVVDNKTVRLISPHSTQFGQTKRFVQAEAHVAKLDEITKAYSEVEDFLVMLNTMFVKNLGDHAGVRECISALASNTELKVSDDGFSQSATFSKGIKRVGKDDLPNPVMLAPYATFPEITQPLRPFLLRLRQHGGVIEVCLHSVEDATWVSTCTREIKEYMMSAQTTINVI